MASTLALIAIVSLFGMARCQTWTGTYTTNASCDTSVCCCFSGQFVVTNSTSNMLNMSSSLNGLCSNRTTWCMVVPLPSTSVATLLTDAYQVLSVNLSSDSQRIYVNDMLNSKCSMVLFRVSGDPSYANEHKFSIFFLLPLTLLGLTINAFAM